MEKKQFNRDGQTFFVWNKNDKYGIKLTMAADGVRIKHGDLELMVVMPRSALAICNPEIQVKTGNIKVIH